MAQSVVVVPATPMGPMPDAWRRCVGTGRMNLALRSDYRESLARVQREIGFTHIRGHGLLSDDMGVLRTHVDGGRSSRRYAFTYVDQVVDMFLSLGVRAARGGSRTLSARASPRGRAPRAPRGTRA